MEELVRQAERAARLLQSEAAKERIRGGDEARAYLFEQVSKAILDACARAVIDPQSLTPPGGSWLEGLELAARDPRIFMILPAQRFLIRRTKEARHLLKLALDIAKFVGDHDFIGATARWIDRIDRGYLPTDDDTGGSSGGAPG